MHSNQFLGQNALALQDIQIRYQQFCQTKYYRRRGRGESDKSLVSSPLVSVHFPTTTAIVKIRTRVWTVLRELCSLWFSCGSDQHRKPARLSLSIISGRSFARRTGNFVSVKMANPRASIKEDRFLYEWLTGSSHGRSVIQRAEIFGRKKVSRRSRHGGSSGRDADEENTNMEAQQRLRQHLQVSNRRYCRYVNDRLLREMAPPLNVEEIGKLFAPPPWGERNVLTPFERITGAGEDSLQDMAAWEPFQNNVDMDKEAQILEVSTRHRPKKDERDLTGIMAAMKAWSTVERRSREALRQHFNSSLVEAFEERILAYAKNAEYGEGLTLEVENPFHRLLLHGICEFYGLVSKTVSKWEDTDGGFRLATKTYIRKKRQSKNSNCGELVQMKIVHFLSIVKNAVPNCEAAA